MRFKTAALAACVIAAISLTIGWTVKLEAQSQKVYTFSWIHDGIKTDSYNVYVDGGTPISVPMTACTGTMPTRTCSQDVTLTTNVQHTILIEAVNIYGVTDADPFAAGPPTGKPTGVSGKVK